MAKDNFDARKGSKNKKKTALGAGGLAAAAALTAESADAQAVPAGFVQVSGQGATYTLNPAANTLTITSANGTVVLNASQFQIVGNSVFVPQAVATQLGLTVVSGGALVDTTIVTAVGGVVAVGAAVAGGDGGGGGGGGGGRNAAPVADPSVLAPVPATTGVPFTFNQPQGLFTDPDGDTLTFSAVLSDGSPLSSVGLSIDATSGEITGVFTGTQAVEIEVTATDPSGDSAVATVDVAFNTVPTSTPIANQAGTEGQALSLVAPAAAFSDGDGDTLTFSALLQGGASLASVGLAIDAATGEITGTPNSANDLNIVITAEDGKGGVASQVFLLEVNAVPTVATPIPGFTLSAGDAVNFNVPANTFADDGPLAITIGQTAAMTAAGITANGAALTGTFQGTQDVTIPVTATDTQGESVTTNFVITANEAPVISSPLNDLALVDTAPVNINAAGAFSDPDGDALTYSATFLVDAPTLGSTLADFGLSLDPTTGAITGNFDTTEIVAFGGEVIEIFVTATDPFGQSASTSFEIRVNEAPVVTSSPSNQNATVGENFNFTIPADTFQDFTQTPLTITAELNDGSDLSTIGLSFDAVTGTFSGVFNSASNVRIRVTATDEAGESAQTTFRIFSNEAPTVSNAIADQQVVTGQAFNFVVPANTFADTDNDPLVLNASLVGGGDLSTVGLSWDGVRFSGTPTQDSIDIVVRATDPSGAVVTDTFTLTVNDPPTVNNPLPDQTFNPGDAVDIAVPGNTFRDPGDILQFATSVSGGGASSLADIGLAFNGARITGTFTSTEDVEVTITVTDTAGSSVSDTFTIFSNNAPVVDAAIPDQELVVFDFLDVSALFSDPDGDALTFTASVFDPDTNTTTTLPDAQSEFFFNDFTGNVSTTTFIPPIDDGDYNSPVEITIVATDPFGLTAQDTFSVTLLNTDPTAFGFFGPEFGTTGQQFLLFGIEGNFRDDDQQPLTFDIEVLQGNQVLTLADIGLAYDPAFDEISGILTTTKDFDIRVTATDTLGGSVTDQISVEVDSPPVVNNSPGDQFVVVGDTFNIRLPNDYFTDPDGDFSFIGVEIDYGDGFGFTFPNIPPATDMPGFEIAFNFINDRFSSIVFDQNDVGKVYTIRVTGTDDNFNETVDEFDVTIVAGPNTAPVVDNQIPTQNVSVGDALNFTIPGNTFSDPDNDTLTLTAEFDDGNGFETILPGVPDQNDGIRFNNGVITSVPVPANFGGQTLQIRITADDGNGGTVSETFDLVVAPLPNTPPIVDNEIPTLNVQVGDLVNFTVPADTFFDADGDPLTLTAELDEGNGFEPILPGVPDINDGVRFNNGVLTTTAVDAQFAGQTVQIRITADDGNGGTVSETFDVDIAPLPNTPPVVDNPIPDVNVQVGDQVNFTVPVDTFFDADGDPLTLTAELDEGNGFQAILPGVPDANDGIRFNNGVLTTTPAPPDVAGETIQIRITADDGNGGTVSDTFDLNIAAAPGNTPPVVNQEIPALIAPTGTAINFTIDPLTFDDTEDGGNLTFTAEFVDDDGSTDPIPSGVAGANPGAGITFNNGTLSSIVLPPEVAGEQITIRVTATDSGGLTTSTDFQLIIPGITGQETALPGWLAFADEYGTFFDDTNPDEPANGVHSILDSDEDTGAPFGAENHWEGLGVFNTPTQVTYSFVPIGGEVQPGQNPFNTTQEFSASQEAFIRTVLDIYESIADVTFTEVADQGLTGSGDIRFTLGTGAELQTSALAFAFNPFGNDPKATTNNANNSVAGDVFINSDFLPADSFQSPYGDENNTIAHEILHAMGFDHPFAETGANAGFFGFFDAGQDMNGDIDLPNYSGDLTGGAHETPLTDTMMETIMTYHNPFLGANFNLNLGGGNIVRFEAEQVTPWEPGVYDIAALQHLYGPNTDTNSGDTTYEFFDDVQVFKTIWDGGGIDEIIHNGDEDAIINLNPGSESIVGFFGGGSYEIDAEDFGGPGTVFTSLALTEPTDGILTFKPGDSVGTFVPDYSPDGQDDDFGLSYTLDNGDAGSFSFQDTEPSEYATHNMSIAFGVVIENATGGDGDDLIVGNTADNIMTGNGGMDQFVFNALAGDDTVKDFVVNEDLAIFTEIGQADVTSAGVVNGDFVITALGMSVTFEGVNSDLVAGQDYVFV